MMNVLLRQISTMTEAFSVPQMPEGLFLSILTSCFCSFCIHWYGQNISRTFKPNVKSLIQSTVLRSAYSCLLSRNSDSAVFINGFKNYAEINTEQGHDLAFFKLCCHTFYVCHCQMGEKYFDLFPQNKEDNTCSFLKCSAFHQFYQCAQPKWYAVFWGAVINSDKTLLMTDRHGWYFPEYKSAYIRNGVWDAKQL